MVEKEQRFGFAFPIVSDDIRKVPEESDLFAVAIPPVDRVYAGAVGRRAGENKKALAKRREIAHALTVAEPQPVQMFVWRAAAE